MFVDTTSLSFLTFPFYSNDYGHYTTIIVTRMIIMCIIFNEILVLGVLYFRCLFLTYFLSYFLSFLPTSFFTPFFLFFFTSFFLDVCLSILPSFFVSFLRLSLYSSITIMSCHMKRTRNFNSITYRYLTDVVFSLPTCENNDNYKHSTTTCALTGDKTIIAMKKMVDTSIIVMNHI